MFNRGSSAGDLGDVTPCNTSPNISSLMTFRPILRNDSEKVWKQQIQNTLINLNDVQQLFQHLNKLIKVNMTKIIHLVISNFC